jgi:uncharacterized protein YndB with AHSA1/START domain
MDRVLHQSVRLRCSPSHAFEMFTEGTHLAEWLAAEADVEPVVGGRYEVFWDPDDREVNSTLGCRVTAVKADELIAFEWRGPVQHREVMNDADPLTHVVVALARSSTDPDWTDVNMIHSGWRSGPEWAAAADYFEKAWSLSLARLERLVNEDSLSPSEAAEGA